MTRRCLPPFGKRGRGPRDRRSRAIPITSLWDRDRGRSDSSTISLGAQSAVRGLRSSSLGANVLVEAEGVLGVVLPLQGREPGVLLGAVGRAHALAGIADTQVVDVNPARIRGHLFVER